MKDVIDMVECWLKKNGYDGLSYDAECGCIIGDIAPCGEIRSTCVAGYKVVPPKSVKSHFDFYICDSRDDKPWEM
jgi:hypothetical protein